MSEIFTLYAVYTGSVGGVPTEHTYVLSDDGHTWNCFGRYADGRLIRSASASSKWAGLIYGSNEKNEDQDALAAGIRVRYHGVCQNAANRILVLAGDVVDARGSEGNAFATLMFGKYGFNIQQYMDTVKSTGQQLLQSNPGEINPSDIQIILDRITTGQSPDAELDILHADLKIEEHTNLPDLTDAQRNAFRPIYSDYQVQRAAAFLAVSNKYPPGPGVEIATGPLKESLIGPWENCVERLIAAVGLDQFKMMFGLTPDLVKQVLG